MPVRLVVDANVAIAAGQSEHPVSSRCREFLDKVIKGDFRVIMTKDIEYEWKDPTKPRQTNTSRRWLVRLYSEKKVDWQDDVFDSELRDELDALDDDEYSAKMRLLMLEDVHLLEAALATDRNVSSLDEAVRKLFNRAAVSVDKIKVIVWRNPTMVEDDCISWLENGCPVETRKQLGYVADE